MKKKALDSIRTKSKSIIYNQLDIQKIRRWMKKKKKSIMAAYN